MLRPHRILALCLLVPGCREQADFGELGIGNDTDPRIPRVGEWTLDRFEFNHADGLITEIRIGGETFGDNFANRGDIVVIYDADPNTLEVEWRPFTNTTPERTEAELSRLTPWYSDGSFEQPQPIDPLTDGSRCRQGPWLEGCGIRAYFDGLAQPDRSGIDFRIHLPPEFVGKVDIVTDDNVSDDDYRNRGNVCLWDLPGTADVRVDSGLVFAKLADSVQAAPTCPVEGITACETDGWSTACPCLADGHGFGQLDIRGAKSDIVVDAPPGLWTRFAVDTPSPSAQDELCAATIDVSGAVVEQNSFGTSATGHVGQPAGAIAGGGYFVRAESEDCGGVFFTESPEAFVPGGDGTLDERRGDITICEDCIQAASCDDLLSGAFRVR